jgi:hypothetical protein
MRQQAPKVVVKKALTLKIVKTGAERKVAPTHKLTGGGNH